MQNEKDEGQGRSTENGTSMVAFTFENQAVRTVMKDGDPWFVAADVCKVLAIKDASDAVERLDEDEKGKVLNQTAGGEQTLLAVNEFGLYNLILGSRKPEAKPFKRWALAAIVNLTAGGRAETARQISGIMQPWPLP